MNAIPNSQIQSNTRQAFLETRQDVKAFELNYEKQSWNDEKHYAVTLLAPLLFTVAGTGGAMTAYSATELSRWTQNSPNPLISVETSSSPNKSLVQSLAEHVANIRDGFAISMSDLASVLGVTRPTAYSWLKGDEPKSEKVPRIQRLSNIADRVREMNISRMDKLVRRPLSGGRSLLDVLKAEEDPTELLDSLQALAAKEAQTRQKPKGSGKNLRSLDDALGDFSAPIDFDPSGAS